MKEDLGYTTYPAELEKRTRKSVSRAGATLVCEQLVEMGILQLEKKRSPTWSQSTPHYSLREDKEAFITLTKNYFLTLTKSNPYSWQSHAIFFMSHQYVRRQINSTLVRDTLSSKKINMPLLMKIKKIKNQEVITGHFQNSIPFSFPVMPPHTTIEEMSSKVIIHNDELTDDQIEDIPKIIENHYRDVEEKTLILPILALLQISPSALEHFLSDWKPYVRDENSISFSSVSQGFDMIEHVLFRLVWSTINDLSLTRAIPEMGDVRSAYISGGTYPASKLSPLLLLRYKDGLSFEYEAGFDTNHDYYVGESEEIGENGEIPDFGESGDIVEIETNPENCSVKINWRKESPLDVLAKVDPNHSPKWG